jgi:hypothetical protein
MPQQKVIWKRPGTIKWGAGWVETHGHSKTHEPGEQEHVGFANFDLAQNALPAIQTTADGLVVDISQGRDQAMAVLAVIRYHGFEFAD